MDRADWLLWLMVETGQVKLDMALAATGEIVNENIKTDEAKTLYIDFVYAGLDTIKLHALKTEAGRAAFDVASQWNDLKKAHELEAIAFLCVAYIAYVKGSSNKALAMSQCVFNNIVAAKTGSLAFGGKEAQLEHKRLCKDLRDRLLSAGRPC